MNTNRKIAIIVGILYITGTVAGILSLTLMEPIRNAQDPLVQVSANENLMVVGALFGLELELCIDHGFGTCHDPCYAVSHLKKIQ